MPAPHFRAGLLTRLPLTDSVAVFADFAEPNAVPASPEGSGGLPDVPVPLWRAGPDGGRQEFNPAWLALTGRPLAAERGEGWLDGVHPDDRERCRTAYAESGGSRDVAVTYRLRRGDGNYRPVRETARAQMGPDGAVAGFVGACAEIDNRAAADASAEGRPADAEEAAQEPSAREASLREAQHRARNTVQVILSLLNLYGRAVPPEAASLFGSLTQRIRALGIVAGSLPESPDGAVVDLTDYLQQIARQLAGVYGAEASVTVEGARAELEPARAHAVGTVVAELLGSFLRPAERRREGVAIVVTAPENGALRVAIRGEEAAEEAPAKLGDRLTAAYATRAGIELFRAEGLIELTIPMA